MNKNVWDLKKLVKSDKEFNDYVKKIKTLVNELEKYRGKILKSSENLYAFLSKSETLSRLFERVYVYSYLTYYENTKSDKGQKLIFKANELSDLITVKLNFQNSEMLSSEYSYVLDLIKKDERLNEYSFLLEKMFRYKKHVLSSIEEQILANAKTVLGVSSDAFESLNNADIKFDNIRNEKGESVELNQSNYSGFLESKSRRVRKEAFSSMYKFYKEHINLLSTLYISSVKEDFFYSKTRKYDNPLSSSLYGDKINVSLFNNLIKVTNNNVSSLQKYLDIKKNRLKLKELHMYDIYAGVNTLDKSIKYEECKNILFEALSPLGKEYIEDLKKSFGDSWVDVYYKSGKRSGAYSWGCYDVTPYVSVNYEGDIDSVSTLAHELGHAMHSYYSNKTNSYSDASYPIFLAEIASTVNEILLSEYFLKNAKSKKEKIYYLNEFIEKFRATVFRQVMFSEFENNVYDTFGSGKELTKETLIQIYESLNKKYYSPAVIIDDEIKYEWARIPHFYTPFYVYKYATGFISALIIASRLQNDENFYKKYIKFLSSGGSDYPLNILKKLGIDITDEVVLEEAFKLFTNKVDSLEELLKCEE